MATEDNVKTAYAGESQANRKYFAFSVQADTEGFKNVAKLYRAASEAEAIHATRLLKVSGGIGATADNLKKSIEGETHEFTIMYPDFIKVAEAEKKTEAGIAFNYAMKAEQVHAGLYKKALEAIQGKRDLTADKIFVCSICGNIVIGEPPERCPICSAFKKKFQEVL